MHNCQQATSMSTAPIIELVPATMSLPYCAKHTPYKSRTISSFLRCKSNFQLQARLPAFTCHAAQLQQHLPTGIYCWQLCAKSAKCSCNSLCIFTKVKNSWWVTECRYHQECFARDGQGHMEVRASLQWPLTSTSAASSQAVKMAASRSENVAC